MLVDVIAECMGSEQSELANIGEKAIRLVTETCKYILGKDLLFSAFKRVVINFHTSPR